jgi:hypothetical protein
VSLFVPKFDDSVIVRDADAEVVGGDPLAVKLLADSSASGGAPSTVRVTLAEGADGARPHLHHHSAAGGTPAVAPGSTADLLVVITPGVERFEYFRRLQRIRLGEAGPESLLEAQDLYDNHFLRSETWDAPH